MKFCPHCNSRVEDSTVVCPFCHQPIADAGMSQSGEQYSGYTNGQQTPANPYQNNVQSQNAASDNSWAHGTIFIDPNGQNGQAASSQQSEPSAWQQGTVFAGNEEIPNNPYVNPYQNSYPQQSQDQKPSLQQAQNYGQNPYQPPVNGRPQEGAVESSQNENTGSKLRFAKQKAKKPEKPKKQKVVETLPETDESGEEEKSRPSLVMILCGLIIVMCGVAKVLEMLNVITL